MATDAFSSGSLVLRPDHAIGRWAAVLAIGSAACSIVPIVMVVDAGAPWFAALMTPFCIGFVWIARRLWGLSVVLEQDVLIAHNVVRTTRVARTDVAAFRVTPSSENGGAYPTVTLERRDGSRLMLVGASSKPGPDGQIRPERRAEIQRFAAALGLELAD